jgi:hypothetical protein
MLAEVTCEKISEKYYKLKKNKKRDEKNEKLFLTKQKNK